MYKIVIYSIILVLIISILVFTYKTYEGFDENHEQPSKTIYLVWRNMRPNIGKFEDAGLGDKVRGAIYLYRICNKYNYTLKVDGTDDVASFAFKNLSSPHYRDIKDHEVVPYMNNRSSEDNEILIKSAFRKTDAIYVLSNNYPTPDKLSKAEQAFAKHLLEPTNEYITLIASATSKLPANYGIQHFRFNDAVFERDIEFSDPVFRTYDKLLSETYKPTDVLITNSTKFKQYAIKMYGISTIECADGPCLVGHVGQRGVYDDYAKNTFVEFFVLCGAKYINTHTTYTWPSGFVKWPSEIYEIPLTDTRVNEKSGKVVV